VSPSMKILWAVAVLLLVPVFTRADSFTEVASATVTNTVTGGVEHFNESVQFDRDGQTVILGSGHDLSSGALGSFNLTGFSVLFHPATTAPGVNPFESFLYSFDWTNAASDVITFGLLNEFVDNSSSAIPNFSHWLVLPGISRPDSADWSFFNSAPTMSDVQLFPTTAPAPESSSLVLLGVGLIGVMLMRRKWSAIKLTRAVTS
jgi:hypothetical protein